jgi:hypothetical protein
MTTKFKLVNKNFLGLALFSMFLLGCNNGVGVKNTGDDDKIIKDSDLSEPENYNGIKTCEDGQELALKDLEEGKIKYIFSGFGSRQELPENLKKNYGIEIIKVNGVLGIPNNCYNAIMYQEIQKKFGNDAFNKAME